MRYFCLLLLVINLLACDSTSTGGESPAEPSTADHPTFTALPAASTGVDFSNHVEENFTNFFARFQYVYNGGGVAIGDVDGDGWSDIFFTANEGSNRLYRNLGDLKFTDVTDAAGVAGREGWSNGTVMADVNGDGYLDIYVCKGGAKDNSPEAARRNELYLNDGKGNFREAAEEYGLDDAGYSLQAVFFDMDNDNDLDAYVTNRPDTYFIPYPEVLRAKERQDPRFSDQLYRNDNGRFTRVTEQAGIRSNFGYGLGLVTADVNNDGFEDIIVSNDYLENDYLYENQGDGTFLEKIDRYTNHTSFYGMGIDVADLNNDGYEDMIQLDMSPEDYVRSKTTMASMNVDRYREIMASGFHDQYMHNSLQLNRGNGFFSEVSQLAGIDKSDWSWACLGADFDNDGAREIFVTNGYRRDVADKDGNIEFRAYLQSEAARTRSDEENARHVIAMFKSVPLQNYLYDPSENLQYRNVATRAGLTEATFSNGAAYGDLDRDGDLDLVVNNLEGTALVYRNDAAGNHFLRVQLEGPAGNPTGLGAELRLTTRAGVQAQRMRTVRGYLSSMEPIAHFGIARGDAPTRLRVTWPDGKESVVDHPTVDETISVLYATAVAPAASGRRSAGASPAETAWWRDATAAWFDQAFRHVENDFDDYASQVLLPHGHSRSGPAVATGDLNGDGLEDFYVGGAKGHPGAVYMQATGGGFTRTDHDFLRVAAGHEDTAAEIFDADGDGDEDLYVVSGGSEFPAASPKFQDRLYLNDGQGSLREATEWLPEIRSSGGCVSPFDMDGDGDLDLFVGGRVVPAKYPRAPRSYLLENTGSGFRDVTEAQAPELARIGMVTSALWRESAAGATELVVVGEWMPITVFRRETEGWRNVTAAYGLSDTQGWWNKVVSADVDGDGDRDIVAGNLGLNYKFHASADKPFYVFASDFDRNGSNDIFLAKKNGKDLKPIRGRECSSQQVPGIAEKFPTYGDFAQADLDEIIDLERPGAVKYEAREFASGWLENQGGSFRWHPLPLATQFSVVNAIVSLDVDGDGRNDLITAGNKFEVEIETTRADAGVGNVLLAKPDGLEALTPAEGGLFLPGNIKGLYPIRLGEGGDPGLLVAENDAPLRLFVLRREPVPSR